MNYPQAIYLTAKVHPLDKNTKEKAKQKKNKAQKHIFIDNNSKIGASRKHFVDNYSKGSRAKNRRMAGK